MTPAQTMLKMIEEVDPSDTAKLDEIDARVWCYLNNYEFLNWIVDNYYNSKSKKVIFEKDGKVKFHGFSKNKIGRHKVFNTQLTRSRDALKSIRPEGWTFQAWHPFPSPTAYCQAWKVISGGPEIKGYSKTEELAELHAIIQAIEWERDHA